MPTYTVIAVIKGGQYVGEFGAEDEERAKEMAAQHVDTSFCHQCGDKIEDAQVVDLIVEETP